jgi:hypothetical protein
MRARIIGGMVALVLVVVVATQVGGGPGRDAISGAAGRFSDPPFSVRLGGPLWRARTLRDNDGAQDFALVARDLSLEVTASGGSKARVAQLELRVDGRATRVVSLRCKSDRCPVSTTARFLPPLNRLPPGEHRVDVVVRDPVAVAGSSAGGEHFTTFGFSVHYVSRVPPVKEALTISRLRAPSSTSGVTSQERRQALDVVSAARRGGGVAAALGSSRVAVVQAGRLEAPGRRIGVTMLVSLTPPAYDVHTTVPAFVPIVSSGNVRYTAQQVQMDVAVLRDVLIDVDLANRRVISLEPGPSSRSLGWSPSKAPTPAGAADED